MVLGGFRLFLVLVVTTFALDWLWVCSKIVKKTIITRALLESCLESSH